MITTFKDVLSPMRFWMWSLSGAQDGHDCCLTILGIQHAEEAFVDGSCSSCKKETSRSCIIDSAMSNMAGSLCLCHCHNLVFVPAPAGDVASGEKKKDRGDL